eukprot:CAMPEP_0170517086 /NCGR_PEP_ID=MMETSP0209-20121228/3173_1 /TAXON_ID=665100 ORGANISM="Litonotus pictus, Strain P1" /NCGR_SAMPLE_ID=MMETSP0209 /ASSEMBLY_ACC=CAM_ASM_000301 /LENGTH=252 /DNA_ID=CAMNT_0010802241 /DNA_START=146 /DNA_END=905 /DNA_ORIENTATION=-
MNRHYIVETLNSSFSSFEEYELEISLQIEKNNEDIYELLPPSWFQIQSKDKIKSFSENYRLVICHSNPLYLYIDKIIVSYFSLEKYFSFILEENLEFEVLKFPKGFVMMDIDMSVLLKYHEFGCWTVLLTYPYMNLSEHSEDILKLIEKNNHVLVKQKKNQEFFDLTSISFFNQEYYFQVIKEINSAGNNRSLCLSNPPLESLSNETNEVFEDHIESARFLLMVIQAFMEEKDTVTVLKDVGLMLMKLTVTP